MQDRKAALLRAVMRCLVPASCLQFLVSEVPSEGEFRPQAAHLTILRACNSLLRRLSKVGVGGGGGGRLLVGGCNVRAGVQGMQGDAGTGWNVHQCGC